ncbi:MAG: GEVED domain-containing protein [Bacteroidales bacterium]
MEPNSGSGLTSTEEVTVVIRNFGANAQSDFDVYFTLNGGSQIVETVTAIINGGETYNYTFNTTVDLSDLGDYTIIVCTDLSGDEFSLNNCKTKLIEHSEPSTSFCSPTYSTGCNSGDGFIGFAVEEIQNLNSNCENNTGFYGWSEYYDLGPAILFPGFTHTFTMGSGYGNQYVNIWIDYNDDFELTPDEMILTDYWIESAGIFYETDIEIPAMATSGVHGMRVMAVHGEAFTDPCGFYIWGEAEDYSVLIGNNDVGNIEGYVIKNSGGSPVSGASIVINSGTYSTVSGPDGYFEMTDVLVGNWSITCIADGYNTIFGMVSVSNGNTTITDFNLTAPTMDIFPQSINIIIDPNAQSTEIIDITNNGDGELYWTAYVEKETDEPKDAWDLQFSFDVQAASGGLGNLGAACDGQYYYTTRWNSNLLHKYDLYGNLIEEFFIPGVSGIRDLAYDGTYFYGGVSTHTIYEMDFHLKRW